MFFSLVRRIDDENESFFVVFLTAMMVSNYASAERVWENNNIKLSDGGNIWANVDYDGSCYTLWVGSDSSTGINGHASNCGGSINGTWNLRACGSNLGVINDGGFSDVINAIAQMCENNMTN
ncbi:hypothetical protein [Aeromonas veronii]|uniref:hypothetical protein n=1 Tax=Aeromonas veronii TaxID=654 RepID=UPI00191CDA04|nr:hypothetical protein [Aeromonas veronii]MBL0440690.1 hypothetical protein [Aeromonas veronii]